jgi:uncharacterized protein DUF3224
VIELKDATGEFKVTDWHEETYADRDPGKLTRAGGTQDFSGDIDGSGRVEWLMCYREDGTAEYVGMQEIDGTVDGHTGEFVLTAVGSFDGERSRGTWTIVPGSGKEDLAGIVGNGVFNAGPGPQASFQLSYDLE